MTDKKTGAIPNLNLRPDILAAGMIEPGACPPESVLIRPVDGPGRSEIREILALRIDSRSGRTIIEQKSKSEYRLALEQAGVAPGPMQGLLSCLDEEVSRLRIGLALREREHRLGLSPLQPSFFPLPEWLDGEQQKILAFFLPYRSQIRGDWVLTGKCLQTATGQPVGLQTAPSRRLNRAGFTVGGDVLDAGACAGGMGASGRPCVRVTVGPVPPPQLGEWVPGGRWRRFLDEAFLPQFLPENYDWHTLVTVAEPYRCFRIAEKEIPLCFDINSIVE